MNKSLGEFLREKREKIGISLREAARRAGLSPAFLSDIEWGRRFPGDDKLDKLARILEVPAADLRQYDNRPPLDEVRAAMRNDPALGAALRSVIKGGVGSEEIFKLLDDKRKRGHQS